MKPSHGPGCSCTSCVARSESERPSLRKFIADGSRIDKLYLGKYIPLREQKLLTKLIRTRAVYDDVRKELLSSSSVSVRDRADLRPKKRGRKHDNQDKSSTQAILELVDLVDRGKTSGSHKDLSECCSCCICQPNGPHVHGGKEHKHYGHSHHEGAQNKTARDIRKGSLVRHRQGHRGDTQARHGSGHTMSKISMFDRIKMSKDARSKRQLRMRAKHVRSAPCSCTFDIKSTIQRKSRAMIKRMKMRPEKAVPAMEYVYREEYDKEKTFETHGAYKTKALAKKSMDTFKESEKRMKRVLEAGAKTSLRKLKESKFMVEKHLQAEATESVEKLKTVARKSLEKLKTGARKSAEKLKTTKYIMQEKMEEIRKSLKPEPIRKPIPKGKVIAKKLEEKSFSIKKDSITKFREKLKLMEEMEEWICKHECFPEECDPEECLRILMRNRARRASIRESKYKMPHKREKQIGLGSDRKSSTTSSVNVQAQEMTTSTRVGTQRKEGTAKLKSMEHVKNIKTGVRGKTGTKQGTQMKYNKQVKEMKTGAKAGTEKQATQIEYTKQNNEMNTNTRVETEKKDGKQQIKPQISINISTKKKKERRQNVNTKIKDHKKVPKSRSVKSITDITKFSAKPSKTAAMGDVDKKQIKRTIKLRKVSSTRVIQPNVAQEDTLRTTVSNSSVNRQAVRISSSFSFNIEFYKDKPVKSSQTEFEHEPQRNYIHRKHLGTNVNTKHKSKKSVNARKPEQRHRSSETRLKKLKKDSQAGGHVLKRCFCTLKLKSNRTKVKLTKSSTKGTTAPKYLKRVTRHSSESVHTKKLHHSQYRLKPYECAPGVCVPDECDPYECDKLIKQRGVKHNSVSARTSTTRQTKHATSLTNFTLSDSSKRIQAHSPVKKRGNQYSSQIIHERPLVRRTSPHKQAVRIGSTFSFNIEFYKDKPTNANVSRVITSYSNAFTGQQKYLKPKKRKLDKSVDIKELRHLKNRHSQGSASTSKSKYTSAKHSLRRCFCTLKLKPEKGNIKPQFSSKVYVTSRSVITQTRKLQESKKEVRNQRHKHNNLLAYECEPGICTPGKCSPYECLKILNKKQGPRISRHEKQSNTKNKTRSAASFTSRSLTPITKKVQSNVVTYQTDTPARQNKENVIIKKMPKEIKISANSPNRQAVRIGSTFSFDVEFFKDRQLLTNYAPIKYVSPPRKSKNIDKRKNIRDTGSQGDTNQDQISTPVQVEKQQHHNARKESAIKRCFCTLKLYKDKKNKKVSNFVTAGTATPIFKETKHPIMATKATKTKINKTRYAQNLKPYECEPYVCTPGVCNPYECLEIIKRRGNSKEFGISTDQNKVRSVTSFVQNTSISSGTDTVKNRSRGQKTYTKSYRTRKSVIPTNRHKRSINPMGNSRQTVNIGSKFSFNIEFFNDRTLVQKEVAVRTPKVKTKKYDKTAKYEKNTGAEVRELLKSTQKSQADGVKKKHKAADIKPTLKRCFCTLKLRNKKDKQSINTKIKTNLRPPKVYTISRMTIAETKKYTNRQEYEYKFGPHRPEYNHRSKIMIEMEKRELCSVDSIEYTCVVPKYDRVIESDSSLLTAIENSSSQYTHQSIGSYSSCSIDTKKLEVTKHNVYRSVSNIIGGEDTENMNNPKQNTKDFTKQKPSNLDWSRCQVIGGSSFFSRCFCTMNINTDVNGHKLKPYECQHGICVPYECDPYKCQKHKDRRSMRTRASKIAGTNATSISTSSYSNLTPIQRAIKLQSSILKRKAKTAHARNAFVKYKCDPSRPHKQMVRVGSTFSFDIQLSKYKPITRKYRDGPRLKYHTDTKSVKNVNRRAKGTKRRHIIRHSQDSQSGTTMINKGSSGSPMLKRCFCTLKLQQRTKQEKQIQSHATMTLPNTKVEILKAEAGQNTKFKKLPTLDPNECEPNICIPGECNPYKCLDIIKSRNRKYKTKGFGTAFTESKSVSSLTYSRKTKKQRVQSNFKDRRSRENAAKSLYKGRRHTQSTKYLSSNKQVVRIGSNYSFNIEFYKNRVPKDKFQDITFTPSFKEQSKKRAYRTSRISTTTAARRYSQESQAGIRTGHQASGVGPILKRCFCTLKLQKQGNHSLQNKKVNFISQGTRTRAVKETSAMHTRSVMTKEKKFKLKPYECEPNVCVPGECNPYECDKLVKKRLRKEFGTSTGPYGIRSVSSMSSSPTSRAKIVQNDGMQYKHHDRPLQSNNVIAQRIATNKFSHGKSRQSLRFGSSFGFDVEFFKYKSFIGSPTRGKLLEFKNKRNYYRRFNKPPSIISKHKRNTTSKNIRDIESQVLKQKVRSTVTEISPFVKRCFCTLRLNKNNKKIAKPFDKVTNSERKILATDNKISKPAVANAANSADIKEVMVILPPKVNTRISKATYRSTATKSKKLQLKLAQKHNPAIENLDPYECEPGVCEPGKCNPYMCAERIKRSGRRLQSRMSSNDGTSRRSISSYTSPSARSKCTQAKCPGYKHRTSGNKERYVVENRRLKSIENPFRQAVHISSTFSFNIEFYKDKMPELAEISHTPDIGNYKKILKHEETESKKVRNKSIRSQGSHVHNCGLQLQGCRTESKGTGVRPFLKRCFCTLKLHKKGNHQPSPNIPDSKSVKTSTPKHYKPNEENLSIGVGTTHNKYYLRPYECEPNICIPGECDPYKCFERIKKRIRSTATLTSKYTKCQDTQCYKDPKSLCKNTQCYIKSQQNKASLANESKHRSRYPQTSADLNRQYVRMGSNFSFDCEFFKDYTPAYNSGHRKVIGVNNQQNNIVKDSHCQNVYSYKKSQMTGIKTEHKGSGMGTLLKRCFCTLKLKKTPYAAHQTETVNFVSVDVKPKPSYLISKAHGKKTGTEIKCTPRNLYNSKPQAVPGQYFYKPLFQMNLDSKNMSIINRDEIYEKVTKLKQLEKSKENEIYTQPRKKDKYARQSLRLSKLNTTKKQEKDSYMCRSRNTRQYPQHSAESALKVKQRPTRKENSKYIRHTEQNWQKFSSGKEHRNYNHAPARHQVYNPYQQSLRIGSSLSFDIELFKDKNHGITVDPRAREIIAKNYKNRVSQERTLDFTNEPRLKGTSQKEDTNKALHDKNKFSHQKSRSSGVKPESPGVGPLIKRCFCTLKLQKTPEQKLKMKSQFKASNLVSFENKPLATPKVQTHNKNTATKKYSAQNILSLSPYECEPLTCAPGQCDPYECIKRIKKRGRTVATNTKRNNVNRMTEKYSQLCKSKNIQCNFYDKKTVKNKASCSPPHVVNQSRFGNPLHSGVRYGSNISCSIEFFKQTLHSSYLIPRQVINMQIENHDRLHNNRKTQFKKTPYVSQDGCTLKSCLSQANIVKTQDKSVVAEQKKLQRCFCTIKLHNSPPTPKIEQFPKEVTVRRVAVANEINMSELHRCNPQRSKVVLSGDKSHDHESDNLFANKNKQNVFSSCKGFENNPIIDTKKQNKGFNEMKTLLPYAPNKFNQSNSIASFLSYSACTVENYRSRRTLRNIFMSPHRYNVKKNEEVAKHDNQLPRRQDTNMCNSGNKFSLRNVIQRCTQLFNRSSKLETKDIYKDFTPEHVNCTTRFNEVKKNNGRKRVKIQKTDTLKATLSDRGPPHSKIVSIPKKSKSLKITKATEKDISHKNNINKVNKEIKKYSEFQYGDTCQNYKTPIKNYSKMRPSLAQIYKNLYLCSHCQITYDKKTKCLKNQEKPMFINEKVVQFTLVSPDKEIQLNKGKPKKFKNICDDCDEELCRKEVNVYCPCTKRKKGLKPQKEQSQSKKQKVISPKEGILKNCQGDCRGSCESCAHTRNPKKHNDPKNNCQGDCQDNCTTCAHNENPQKLKTFKNVYKADVPQNQEQCNTIKNSKTQKKKHYVKPQKGKSNHECQIINDMDKNEKTKKAKGEQNPPKDKDYHNKRETKENKSIKDKELNNPQKPRLKTNASKKPEKAKNTEEPKKLTEIHKFVCKTKKPCACCDLAQIRKKPKYDTIPSPHHLHWYSSKDKKCKKVCETRSEEDAMMKVMKMIEKCRSKMLVLFPPRKDTCDYKPMFQMRMDAHNMAILNREEINDKVTNLKKKQGDQNSITPEELRLLHGKSCRCCICKSIKHTQPIQTIGISLSAAQRASKFCRMFGIGKEPCICGSAPCASELWKMKKKAEDQKKLEKRRKHPCVCGTKICGLESLKMELKTHSISKKGAKKLKKDLKNKVKNKKKIAEQNKKKTKALKEYLERQKKYKVEDDKRRKKRKKEEKWMDKQVSKYRNTSAWLLAAESVVDVGQFTSKTATGFFRTIGRFIMDPKRTIRQIKYAKQDPGRILTNLKMAWSDSGISSTARRVNRRIGAMSCFQRFKQCMENCAVTNYIYHICDKDPKARLAARKKRLVRRREPMDFECSLYMASLRKKPWLKVYYKFQWFYPHCVSLLHLLRSVGDVMLFLLAVIVWSPCLLAIECCRTLMCCTLCTG